ncbi:cysteine-rich RLK (RECEPTOR-like protein kinase) 8 [Striga hermonthica]|uniref:Cysteine-rich RLK (RECEPTOR-like protein kinase) 8 n=1 Tax=Striga hermonthica TaxID=68872 RepID=A0A9N7MZE2_STRHE|nr:cysteine-rich RLK (RECEPTOR-like protein kinase) 8 [Striga hermonthica]
MGSSTGSPIAMHKSPEVSKPISASEEQINAMDLEAGPLSTLVAPHSQVSDKGKGKITTWKRTGHKMGRLQRLIDNPSQTDKLLIGKRDKPDLPYDSKEDEEQNSQGSVMKKSKASFDKSLVDWATEMTGGSKFEVSKFDGHGNFRLWQTRVKDLLAQQGIQKGLCAEKPKGMEDDDWQDLQERAAGTIWLCLADEVMYHTEEITSALLAHNQRKHKSGESSSQSDSLYVKGNQDRGRRQGRDNSRNRNFRSKSRDKSQGRKTVTCYKCKEQGHFKRDCPKWKKQIVDMSSKEWFATYKPGNSGSVFLGDDRCCGIVAVLDKGESSSSALDDVDHDVSDTTDVSDSNKLARDRVRRTNIQAPVRAVLAFVASWDLHLEQIDVKTAFLHGDLAEPIYMQQPDGFVQPGKKHLFCRLNKSLYGLKQASRQWNILFDSYMLKIGYKRCEFDCCVYTKSLGDGSIIFLLLYGDDMFIAAKNMRDIVDLKSLLSQEFEMKDLGAAKKILGIEIHRDRGSKKLWLSQKGYVEKVLQRFGMNEAKPVDTPLANQFKLFVDMCPKSDKEIQDMVEIPYASAVGCQMYAMVCTRPDLAHVVGQVCKYISRPGKQHWEAVKWIFRYLKSTSGHGDLPLGMSSLLVEALFVGGRILSL